MLIFVEWSLYNLTLKRLGYFGGWPDWGGGGGGGGIMAPP